MVRVRASRRLQLGVKLAFISALVFEISQLQSAQDQVVLARTNAIIVRSGHYELVAMRGAGPQNSHARIARNGPAQILYSFAMCDLHSPMLKYCVGEITRYGLGPHKTRYELCPLYPESGHLRCNRDVR